MSKSIALLLGGVACTLVSIGTAAEAAPPGLAIAASSPRCVDANTTISLQVTGAVPGGTYALYGTSGYQASDPITAPAADFTTPVQINHGYLGFTGDLETQDRRQSSNVIDVIDACHRTPSPTDVSDPITTHPVTTHPVTTHPVTTHPVTTHPAGPTVVRVTHTDVLRNASPTAAPRVRSVPHTTGPSSEPSAIEPSATAAAGSTQAVLPVSRTTSATWPTAAAITGGVLVAGSLAAGFLVRRRARG